MEYKLTSLSSRLLKLVENAAEQARQSQCMYKLGALITRGKEIYTSRSNDNSRCQFLREHRDASIHAEMNVLNQFINTTVRHRQNKFSFSNREKQEYYPL
jgi:hypothetical protein